MLMNIEKILNCLVPEYQIKRSEPEIVPEINLDIPRTEFDSTGFTNFFSCVTHGINVDKDESLSTIKSNLEKYEYVDTLNKKKVIMSIERNDINHTTKLFLAMHFNINIFEYHEKTKILKVYYPEEQLHTEKQCILLFCQNPNTFSVATDNVTFKYIMETLPNILTVAIGLTIDKKFSTSPFQQSYDFIIGEVKTDDDWINEDNIIRKKPNIELYVPDTFDWRTFDVKALNKSFDKKKLLLELYSLKIQK